MDKPVDIKKLSPKRQTKVRANRTKIRRDQQSEEEEKRLNETLLNKKTAQGISDRLLLDIITT